MADFPRTVLPASATELDTPGPLISRAQSGRVLMRSTQQAGRTWRETFTLNTQLTAHKAFLAQVRNLYRNGTSFDIAHIDYLVPKGTGGGSPLVNGGTQTGATLVVDATPNALSNWLRAGDLISVVVGSGVAVFEVTADVTTSTTNANIPINPPIYSGGSPADNAAVTITGVKMRACIVSPPAFPDTSGTSANYGTLELQFAETME